VTGRCQQLVLSVLATAGGAWAQTPDFFEPPSPTERRALVAVHTSSPPTIDGALDDAAWVAATASAGFVQVEPRQGAPATNASSVRLLFDDRALYIAADLPQPEGRFNQRDLKRDFETNECDLFSVYLDPLGDGRNAFIFSVNPYGAQRDVQVIDDSIVEPNWDTVWRVATRRSETAWSVEFAIPFKSLRYGPQGTPWGIQFLRRERGVNEDTVFSRIPRSVGAARMAYSARVDGLVTPPPSLALQLRPYVIGRLLKDGDAPFAFAPNVGGEVTWSPTSSTVLDLTVNTDFAETDVDRRVVNLSRFNVFFPERRQFFLESAGLFNAGFQGFLQPFFSRRIGLEDGAPVPIGAGTRFVYRSEQRSAGGLAIFTPEHQGHGATLFGVGRYTHHLGEQSRVGGMVVAKHAFAGSSVETNTNVVPVVDGFFRSGPFTTSASLMGSITNAPSTGTSLGWSATWSNNVSGPWGNLEVNGFNISKSFEARTGFVARENVVGLSINGGLDLRPLWRPAWLRNFGPWVDSYALWQSSTLQFLETNVLMSPWWMQFSGGDEVFVAVEHSEQRLSEPFSPVRRVSFAPGAYGFDRYGVQFLTQASRVVAFQGDASFGRYYSASRFGGRLQASVQPIPHVRLAAQYSFNRFWGEGVESANVDTHLWLLEARLALTPKLQLIGSYQRDTDGNASILNARVAWEFLPLSFVYVVLTDTRGAFRIENGQLPELRLVAKVTYTFRP